MQTITALWRRTFYDARYRFILHIIFWIIFLLYARRGSTSTAISPELPLWISLSGILVHVMLFYPLVYLIVPLFQKKRWIFAAVCLIVVYTAAGISQSYHITSLLKWLNEGRIIQFDGQRLWQEFQDSGYQLSNGLTTAISSAVYLTTLIFIPLCIKTIRNTFRTAQQQAALANENIQLQLSQLRSQIHPHLFFNTLNNLQSFIVQNEKQRSIALLDRLAGFMRISLYEINTEWIPVNKEIALIRHYYELERVRFEGDSQITMNATDFPDTAQVPALLMLPFLENAFTYSGNLCRSDVFISLEIHEENNNIQFVLINRYGEPATKVSGGIGLTNVKLRLEHYYPGTHRLNIRRENDLFTVELTIPIR